MPGRMAGLPMQQGSCCELFLSISFVLGYEMLVILLSLAGACAFQAADDVIHLQVPVCFFCFALFSLVVRTGGFFI